MKNDFSFPALQKNYECFAFRNGVVFLVDPKVTIGRESGKPAPPSARKPCFFTFRDTALPTDLVACNFFDQVFEEEWCDMEVGLIFDTSIYSRVKHPFVSCGCVCVDFCCLQQKQDWRDIPTPLFHKIATDQKWEPAVIDVMYAFFGRLLFPLTMYDNFQVFPMFIGLAGTGKSTFCKVAEKFFDSDDVGSLSNNIEEKFGLEAFYTKRLITASEIKRDFRINMAEFQQMITADYVSIKRKNKVAVNERWTVPICAAGNELPSWNDSAGAFNRRVLGFQFKEKVREVSQNLLDDIELSEMGAILVKSVRAYFEFIAKNRNRGIWDRGVLPKYFTDVKSELMAEMSQLHQCMNSPISPFVFGIDLFIPFDTFRTACDQWFEQRGNTGKVLWGRASSYQKCFSDFDLVKKIENREWRGKLLMGEFVFGCDLKPDTEFTVGSNASIGAGPSSAKTRDSRSFDRSARRQS